MLVHFKTNVAGTDINYDDINPLINELNEAKNDSYSNNYMSIV